MTSFSSILGMLPLVFASGEGANGRIAMGTAVVGGLVVSTLISMFIVPAMYMYISTDRRKRPQALPEPVLMVEGAGAVPVEVAVSVDEVADTAAGNEETVNSDQE